MSRSNILCAALLLIMSHVSAGDHLPGTLILANVIGDRVVQTVGETASNEKEVDFGDFDNDNDLDGEPLVGVSDLVALLIDWGPGAFLERLRAGASFPHRAVGLTGGEHGLHLPLGSRLCSNARESGPPQRG